MKKKGFTLIELLAVIVILAIIALIAVPLVLNIIEKSRKGAAKSSAVTYVKATETYLVTSELDKTIKEEDKLKKNTEYKVNDILNLIEVKGDKPSGGTIKIGNKNEVESARLIINGYVITYDGKDYKVLGKAENLPETYSSISFENSSLELIMPATLKLNPTLAPADVMDGTLVWSSSDESIATVDNNGVVTGVSYGTVTITVMSRKNNDIRATVSVKVKVPCDDFQTSMNQPTNKFIYEGKEFIGTGVNNVLMTPILINKTVGETVTTEAITNYCTGCRFITTSEATRMTVEQRKATWNGSPQLWVLDGAPTWGYVCYDGTIKCSSDYTGSSGNGIRPAVDATDFCVVNKGNNTYQVVN